MNNELVIDVRETETVIALLEDKRLVELSREKNNKKFSVGDIFLGKVKKIMTGLNAAFVNVGSERDAFLHYLDLGPQFRTQQKYLTQCINSNQKVPLESFQLEEDINKHGKITELFNSGQHILVQIAKEPISTKGPRITSEITIAGRNLVLIPFSDKVSISQKIKSQEEKDRLKRLIMSIKPNNYGVIVRTVARNRRVAVLHSELNELVKKWENMFDNLNGIEPPSLIMGELNRTSALLRDVLNSSFNSIYANNANLLREIRDYVESIAPEKKKIVKSFTGGSTPIFESFGIEKQIKGLFGKTVTIKTGAYLIIEHTEALHVIDVNSGNRSRKSNDQETNAVDVNIAAAEEIARQLRLRDMGGIIVVDFIDMHLAENKRRLFDKMKEAMSTDRTKHNILPLSKFGLMQITRQRVRPEMSIETVERCPTCDGSGEITPSVLFVDQLFNNVQYLAESYKSTVLTIKLHPYIASYITSGIISKRLKWSLKAKKWIKVVPVSSYSFLAYNFFDAKGDKIEN